MRLANCSSWLDTSCSDAPHLQALCWAILATAIGGRGRNVRAVVNLRERDLLLPTYSLHPSGDCNLSDRPCEETPNEQHAQKGLSSWPACISVRTLRTLATDVETPRDAAPMTPGAARNPCSLCGANRRQSARMSGKLVDPVTVQLQSFDSRRREQLRRRRHRGTASSSACVFAGIFCDEDVDTRSRGRCLLPRLRSASGRRR